jgi:cytochrome c oxidase subunit 3
MMLRREHALRIAVWIVIASEALLFAGLFALYVSYRAEYPREFHAAASRDIGWIGGTNTMILLASSFAMAWAIHVMRAERRPTRALACVLALGTAFLCFKAVEWGVHIHDGFTPGTAGDLPARGTALFFTLYYLMTGLHAAHVIAGLVLVAWTLALARRGTGHLAVELVGLYWHFVDAVWVFLWPLFYLLP